MGDWKNEGVWKDVKGEKKDWWKGLKKDWKDEKKDLKKEMMEGWKIMKNYWKDGKKDSTDSSEKKDWWKDEKKDWWNGEKKDWWNGEKKDWWKDEKKDWWKDEKKDWKDEKKDWWKEMKNWKDMKKDGEGKKNWYQGMTDLLNRETETTREIMQQGKDVWGKMKENLSEKLGGLFGMFGHDEKEEMYQGRANQEPRGPPRGRHVENKDRKTFGRKITGKMEKKIRQI